MAGSELTQDNFTFHKEPIGIDDPDKEIIRDAKLKTAMKVVTFVLQSTLLYLYTVS